MSADIRTERDQARPDLATERARSAGLTRALEVASVKEGELRMLLAAEEVQRDDIEIGLARARKALEVAERERDELREDRDRISRDYATVNYERGGLTNQVHDLREFLSKAEDRLEVAMGALVEIRDRGTMEDEDTRIASRALAAIDAVTGGAAGVEPCAGCEKARHRDPRDGYCILHQPAALRGTPGAGEAPTCKHCGLAKSAGIHQDTADYDPHSFDTPWHAFAPATTVAQRRPAPLEDIAAWLIAWPGGHEIASQFLKKFGGT